MRKLLSIAYMCLLFNVVCGQGESKIFPPPPNSFAFANYGDYTPNFFDGKIRLDIPVYTYDAIFKKIPISFGYSSSGVLVDSFDNTLGHTWVLDVGGVITRTIIGEDDLAGTNVSPNDSILSNDYKQFLRANYLDLDQMDFTYDVYTYNFFGSSGKFIIDKDHSIVPLNASDLKIELNSDGFTITDLNGVSYFFTEKERTVYLPMSSNGDNRVTAWYLTKVLNINGQSIHFEYKDMMISYNTSTNQTIKQVDDQGLWSYNEIPCPGFTEPSNDFISLNSSEVIDNYMLKQDFTKIVSKIYTDSLNYPSVNFYYKDVSTLPNVNILEKIEVKDPNNEILEDINIEYDYFPNNIRHFLKKITYQNDNKTYEMEYFDPSFLPLRLSKSQDLWGYYNHYNNGSWFVPKSKFFPDGANRNVNPNFSQYGMLKKIIFPTGGYTDFEYEQNSYHGMVKNNFQGVHFIESITENSPGVYPEALGYAYEKTFNSVNADSLEIASILVHVSQNNTACSPSIHIGENPKASVSLTNITDSTIVNISGNVFYQGLNELIRIPNEVSMFSPNVDQLTMYLDTDTPNKTGKFYLKPNKEYRLSIASLPCLDITYNFDSQACIYTEGNVNVGGLRVKRIRKFDGGNTYNNRYYYGSIISPEKSSGSINDTNHQPYYHQEFRHFCQSDPYNYSETDYCEFEFQKYRVFSSNSFNNLYNQAGNNIFYEYVTESLGGDNFEKGAVEHQFSIHRDEYIQQIYGDSLLYKMNFGGNKYSNTGWKNGNEIQTKYFDQSLRNIKTINRNYKKIGTDNRYFYNLAIVDQFNINGHCSETMQNPIYNKAIGAWYYQAKKGVIDEETEVHFISNDDSLMIKNKYDYADTSHNQLIKKTTTFPDSTVQETEYKYAHEKGNQYLIGKNMVGIPLETIVRKKKDSLDTGEIISQVELKYPSSQSQADTKTEGLALPYASFQKPLNTNVMEEQITYDRYDSSGNLLQYTSKEGIPTAIVYGYHTTQPIAQIAGATYDEVASLISTIVNKSDLDTDINTEQQLIDALDAFRKLEALKNYQITTYTYDPLIGVTSITPPSGMRQVYLYDEANRLKEVREGSATGKLLKAHEYHYKQ